LIRILPRGLVSGTAASATSTVALAALARTEGKGALQPVNATSHWLRGEQGRLGQASRPRHTAVGYATHHAATVFWAVLFERWVRARRTTAPLPLLRDAVLTSALAAAVDYGATPKRFTPGWEFAPPKRAMATAYVAMALGLVVGATGTQR
jgi:hypothetical protein